jgi:hypothetical protein
MADRDAAYLAESNAWKLLSTMTIFLGLSWLSVALRIYTRAFLMNGLQLDDWLMLLSQVRSGLEGVDFAKRIIPLTRGCSGYLQRESSISISWNSRGRWET